VLAGAQCGDLRAHQRAVGLVVTQQGQTWVVAERRGPGIEDRSAQVPAAPHGQVHRQECNVVDHVDEAQRGIELDAVERSEPSAPAHDVRAVQVPVALADPALLPALGHQATHPVEHPSHGGLEPVDLLARHAALLQGCEVREIVQRDLVHQPRAAVGTGGWRVPGVRMEAADQLAQRSQLGSLHRVGPQQDVEFLAAVELSHLYREILCALEPVADFDCAVTAGDSHDIEIEIRRVAPVESQFLLAESPARGRIRVVQEAELQRFLDLVRVGPGQQHPGHVGLDTTDRFLDRVGITFGPEQRLDQRVVPVSCAHAGVASAVGSVMCLSRRIRRWTVIPDSVTLKLYRRGPAGNTYVRRGAES
jgi:hypothetical protein